MIGPGKYASERSTSQLKHEKMPRSSIHYNLSPLEVESANLKMNDLGPGT